MNAFTPNYRYIVDVVNNSKPARMPVYEHLINPEFMENLLNVEFAGLIDGDARDMDAFFEHYCGFYREMTYDTVSFEVCITEILPDSGALLGGRPGPIQSRADFDRYPWDALASYYWNIADQRFSTLRRHLPEGMLALGGVGNGVFEISEDLVGFEYLAYMQVDDPDLYADVYHRIGNLMVEIWRRFLERYADMYAVCRFGDDLGFKVSTLTSPSNIRKFILPEYKRVIDLVHKAGKLFLWHSCGNILSIMDDVIDLGINAKHSNEDVIAPFDTWIQRYGDRIGLLGGVDVDILCREDPDLIYDRVVDMGMRFRNMAQGYALGSGNSIPDYVPVESYLAMIRAAQTIRDRTAGGPG
ncbi:MAG: uroporphyrinogen decarboxylase family protein [Anaerolineae bacterium]|nr:uroporphyrinogen decarboxylase family protein [Anaerolineae bacterium]